MKPRLDLIPAIGGALLWAGCTSVTVEPSPSGEGGAGSSSGISICMGGGAAIMCTPGEQRPCACPVGESGVQTCVQTGTAFGLCAGCTAPDVPWSRSGGTPGAQSFAFITVTPDNSVVATAGAVDSSHGPDHFRRYDPSGNVVWDLIFGRCFMTAAADVDGSLILTGSFSHYSPDILGAPVSCPKESVCAYVARLGADGTIAWIRTYDAGAKGAAYAEQATIGPDGRIAVTGLYYLGTLDLGAGPLDGGPAPTQRFVAELSPSGETLWSRRIRVLADYASFAVEAMSLTAAGDLWVSGGAQDALDFGDGFEPLATDAAQHRRSGFVAHYDPSGELVFHRIIGSAPDSDAAIVDTIAGPSGGVRLMGYFGGAFDIGGGLTGASGEYRHVLADLGPGGEYLGSQTIASGYSGIGTFVFGRGVSGELWFGGATIPDMTFAGEPVQSTAMADVLLLRYDAAGAPLSLRQFGTEGRQGVDALIFAKPGLPVIEGSLKGTVDFGQGPLTVVGDYDWFIAKLGP